MYLWFFIWVLLTILRIGQHFEFREYPKFYDSEMRMNPFVFHYFCMKYFDPENDSHTLVAAYDTRKHSKSTFISLIVVVHSLEITWTAWYTKLVHIFT